MIRDEMVLDRVRAHVRDRPHDSAFVFIRRHDDPGSVLTWSELWHKARLVAETLPVGAAADRCGVLISCKDEEHFVVALVAVWMRGATAIPTAGSTNRHLRERTAHVIAAGRPDIILHDLPDKAAASLAAEAPAAAVVDVAMTLDADRAGVELAPASSGALVQLTSGSTSDPKAILLPAGTIAVNSRAIERAFGLDHRSVGVHWLPLHHDMGLIGGVVVPLLCGGCSVLLRPTTFIQRPLSWFEAISSWRGTITSGPNFAYERVARAATSDDVERLDLHSLDAAIVGAEPVHEDTMNRLLDTFGSAGLRPSALAPSYGLAEVTLLASTGRRPAGPRFRRAHAQRSVPSLGRPIAELTVTIVDDHGAECAEGELGRIRLQGASVGQVIDPGDDWRDPPAAAPIDTGDHGYLLDGELYVTGRTSNKIIVRGRNVFAEDVELLVADALGPDTAMGIAAIGVDHDGTEELGLLIELNRRRTSIDLSTINAAVAGGLGVKPALVVTLRSSTLPRTTSGKIRRGLARTQYLDGAYAQRIQDRVGQTGH